MDYYFFSIAGIPRNHALGFGLVSVKYSNHQCFAYNSVSYIHQTKKNTSRILVCLSSAMLRAKIDLRQPSFLLRPRTVTATVSSQGLKNTQFPRFGAKKLSCTSSGCGRHSEIRRHSVLCTGAPTSLPRELHSSDLHMRSRGVPERAHRRTSPLPRACSVNPGLCCSFMKSTRLRLDPQGYIAGDAGVTQRSAHKRSL